MAELMKSLITRNLYVPWYPNVGLDFIYTELNDDMPMKLFQGRISRGLVLLNLDRRTKLSKWLYKHYIGTNKSII